MNMKLDHFKKAAKRYSADAQIPLSTAQEKLAGFFGYTNFHALTSSLEAKQSRLVAENTGFWCGLTHNEFRLLCHCLKERFLKDIAQKSDEAKAWSNRGINLFESCISAMPAAGIQSIKSSVHLNSLLRLESVEDLYLALFDYLGKKPHSEEPWPAPLYRVSDYLEISLPGYNFKVLLEHAKDRDIPNTALSRGDMSRDQHSYRTMQIDAIYLRSLHSIEICGGPSKVSIPYRSGDPKGSLSLSEWLKQIADRKSLPSRDQYELFNCASFHNEASSVYD